MKKLAASVILGGVFLLAVLLVLPTQARPAQPLGKHCGDVGPLPPLDPEFCGCTWGEVLFRGQPVSGAIISLTFGSGIFTDISHLESPYYDLTGYDLGVRRGDVFTLTASFAGQTLTRTIRAWPENSGKQRVAFAFLESGVFSPWLTGSYTLALALADNVVWAGGSAGVISSDLTSGVSHSYSPPWLGSEVRNLAVGLDGHLWATGAGHVAEFSGGIWQTQTIPFTGDVRSVVVDNTTGAIWVGGGHDGLDGVVAVYTGTWTLMGSFSSLVKAVTVDGTGRAWAGTAGDGVYRQNGSGGWDHFTEADGLASDDVDLAAAAGDSIWFGTEPYFGGNGWRGGIGRYNLTTNTWRTYTLAQGLPADSVFTQATAPILALGGGSNGAIWAGTLDGIRFLANDNWWAAYTTTHGLRSGGVTALAVNTETVIAASSAGLDRLNPNLVFGTPPTAQILTVSPLTLTLGTSLTLDGSGQDNDEAGGRIVAWDWSALGQPFCTQASCTLPSNLLPPGVYSISFRVQDNEGVWSLTASALIDVKPTWIVHLPLVMKLP
jgi:hypothetical protein